MQPERVPVLVKLTDKGFFFVGVRYYVCYMIIRHPSSDKPEISFCEASGEEWMRINADIVDSWAPIEDEGDKNGRQEALEHKTDQ